MTDIVCVEAAGRDAASIAEALDGSACDLLLTIGGSGVGRTDATSTALAGRGEVIAHGLALQPGRTAAVGRIGKLPVVALPGAPDQALGGWWTLALPVLDRLSGRSAAEDGHAAAGAQDRLQRRHRRDRAARAERGAWMPLAVGDLSLEAIARADAWLPYPAAAKDMLRARRVDAYMLRD